MIIIIYFSHICIFQRPCKLWNGDMNKWGLASISWYLIAEHSGGRMHGGERRRLKDLPTVVKHTALRQISKVEPYDAASGRRDVLFVWHSRRHASAKSDKEANRLFDADLLLVAAQCSSITRLFFFQLVHLEMLTVKPTESRLRLQSRQAQI